MADNVSPYIEIVLGGTSDSGKTKIWYVQNTSGPDNQPGLIKWHGPWRGYVLDTDPAIYDAKCLRQIADFIDAANAEHKAKS